MLRRVKGPVDRSLHAAKWNYLGNGASTFLQFLFGVIIVRLLGSDALGIVAIGWSMIGIGSLFSDSGFTAALIHRTDLAEKDISLVFMVQIPGNLVAAGNCCTCG